MKRGLLKELGESFSLIALSAVTLGLWTGAGLLVVHLLGGP